MLCTECRAALTGAAPSRVRPVPEPSGLPVVHAAAPYEDEVRAVLLAHKERGALMLAGPLGAALAGAVRAGLGYTRLPVQEKRLMASEGSLRGGNGQLWTEPQSGAGGSRREQGGRPWVRDDRTGVGGGQPSAGSGRVPPGAAGGVGRGGVLLVPVPSSRQAVRARGHDPARRIALAAAGELRRTGTPARVLAVLRQRRAVADQSGLNSRQRLENLAGALEVAAGGERLLADGGRIVLVDDLMTTGASLTEAARAVRTAVPDSDADDVCRVAVRAPAGDCGAAKAAARADRPRAAQGVAGRRETGGVTAMGGAGVMICAAVIAALPDSFEINRN